VPLVDVHKEEFDDTRMHGVEHFEIIGAQQAKVISNYKNAKYKLLKTKPAIWFTKIRGSSHLTPKYVNNKTKGNNQWNKNTKTAVVKHTLNQEIRFLNKKTGEEHSKCM
jgi:hypothetical protein